MFISENLDQFKKLFVTKLKNMLSDDELGAYILVLANSLQDEYLKNELQADLKDNFNALKNNYYAGKLKATPDDIDVFKKLLEMDVDSLPVWQSKNTGDWEVIYNIMRQLRPARASSQILGSIRQDFDETKFHFNKPFLKPEILWEGEYDGLQLRVLFNKFPFSDYHLLIVVSPEKNSSQLSTKDTHLCISNLVKEMAVDFPGFGVGFNSLAAGASVNHLHYQGFFCEQEFSIEKKYWSHNDGGRSYPLGVKRFMDSESSWQYMSWLIEEDTAFNCLYRGDFCYVIPRKYQGATEAPEWLVGAGWIDIAGVITVSDEKTFSLIDEQGITDALGMFIEE